MHSLKQGPVAVIGGGVIGGGWAARLLLNGIDVRIHDPHPEAGRRVREMLANAERAWESLTSAPLPAKGPLSFCGSIAEAVEGSVFIEECTPENLELKQRILAEVENDAASDALIGSSTSGLLPSDLQSEMKHPERLLVTHPFNPVYLLPLVELCGGRLTSPEVLDQAAALFESLGMRPLKLKKEIDGFLADRLLEAIWRESLWLVHDDVASVEDMDDAFRFGPGLRFALMGSFLIYRIAGGEEGIRHFMAQFGPALKWPWTKLMDVPELTDTFLDKIASQSDEQAGNLSIRELEQIRDDGLVAILQGLKGVDWGAGSVFRKQEKQLFENFHQNAVHKDMDETQPMVLHRGWIRPSWIDYNGHMTESRYLQVFGDATDALLGYLGLDQEYLDSGFSVFTVESHIRHLDEGAPGSNFIVKTQLLGGDEKRLHIWHELLDQESGSLFATGEHMLLHVDTRAAKSCTMQSRLLSKSQQLRSLHQSLKRPEAAGRSIALPSGN